MWSDRDIKQGLNLGLIKIEPFDEKALQPASVDLRLGRVFYEFLLEGEHYGKPLDPRENIKERMWRFTPGMRVRDGDDYVILEPQGFLLGSTQEKISLSDCAIGRIEGKSSLARLGLSVHSTGGFIDPGNQDLNITLEIVNHCPIPIKLYVGMWIAQIAFQSTDSPCEHPYGPARGSRYYADSEPVPSKVNEKMK